VKVQREPIEQPLMYEIAYKFLNDLSVEKTEQAQVVSKGSNERSSQFPDDDNRLLFVLDRGSLSVFITQKKGLVNCKSVNIQVCIADGPTSLLRICPILSKNGTFFKASYGTKGDKTGLYVEPT
jgi:hypothetical protein